MVETCRLLGNLLTVQRKTPQIPWCRICPGSGQFNHVWILACGLGPTLVINNLTLLEKKNTINLFVCWKCKGEVCPPSAHHRTNTRVSKRDPHVIQHTWEKWDWTMLDWVNRTLTYLAVSFPSSLLGSSFPACRSWAPPLFTWPSDRVIPLR